LKQKLLALKQKLEQNCFINRKELEMNALTSFKALVTAPNGDKSVMTVKAASEKAALARFDRMGFVSVRWIVA
jgi:hypothetical protein